MAVVSDLQGHRMYSFMGGGLFCAGVGNILLIVSTATDYWMQYRHSGNYMHQGLWRYCVTGKCYSHTDSIGIFVLLAMAVYTGVTVNYYGKRYGNWRFSWSYITGWVAAVLTFFSDRCLILNDLLYNVNNPPGTLMSLKRNTHLRLPVTSLTSEIKMQVVDHLDSCAGKGFKCLANGFKSRRFSESLRFLVGDASFQDHGERPALSVAVNIINP
ncbi:Lens fiber membrane intrinsic protein [Acipenser ruthenus]|uniref:Lens fiber membrane intrinsic protein n=1 Tax=Acipenser ruthenus TaxID=7906 RepID=A0A662YM85_ACIRT|nr:Lens fiber membrane intrinsic protein [Acipenser ruthenus]